MFRSCFKTSNLIEIGRCGEIRGSVIPGIKVTMHIYFMLGLFLVTSDCGITTECGVKKSVNTSAAHICAFCETKPLYKNGKCDAYRLFCGANNHNYSRPNSFRLPRPGSGSSISSKYVGITHSLATRRTLGIPKLLMCNNKAQPEPEPCCKQTQLRSASHAPTKTESPGAGTISFSQELCSPASSQNSQGITDGEVDKVGMSTAAPGRSAVLCGWMHQG